MRKYIVIIGILFVLTACSSKKEYVMPEDFSFPENMTPPTDMTSPPSNAEELPTE